ncbi:MAG: hypothetical protein R3F21_04730 [Myxococcota bacterium]
MGSRPSAITTPFWDAFLTGGVSIVGMSAVFAYLLIAGRPIAFSDADWIALTILVNSTHFMASYRLLYSSRAEIAAHRWSTIGVPALLLGTLVGAAFIPARDTIYAWLVLLSSIYLAWHYTGQAWGMVSVFGRLAAIDFTPRERFLIRFGLRMLLALHVLYALAGRLPPPAWIAPATWIRLYGWAFQGVCALAAISFAAGAFAFVAARRRHGRLPLRIVLPWASIYLWYPFWYFIPGGFLFVQLSHALQYLAFPLRVEANRHAAVALQSARSPALHAVIVYLGLVVAGAAILNGAPLAARWIGEGWYSTPDARAIFMAFTNCVAIHHYFIDGAIWKLSNPKVRRELFRHVEPAGAPTAQERPGATRSA